MKWTLHHDFSEIADDWNDVNARAVEIPNLDARMIECALKHFGSGDERIALARSADDTPVFGAILHRHGTGSWETFQPSQLPIGPVVAAPGIDIIRIVAELARELSALSLSVGLTELDPLLIARPADSAHIATADFVETAWIDLDTSFEDYWAQRGKNLRQNVRRQTAKLEAAGTPPQLHIIERAEDMADAIARFGELESAGWKGEQGTAVRASNAQGRFYTALFERFAAGGQAKVYQLQVGDRIVASDLCLEQAGVHVVLKTAYDETERHYSPSTLLRHLAFATFFDAGRIRRIEFYGKRMEWHTRWTDNVRVLYHLTFYRSGSVRAAADLVRKLRGDAADA